MREINPLNVLNQREVSIMPEHFTKIKHEIEDGNGYYSSMSHNNIVDNIKTWIFNNLDGRFTVTEYSKAQDPWDKFDEDDIDGYSHLAGPYTNKVSITIGFEQPEESTFFSLAYQTQA